jgi:hypothetical protein
MVFLISGTKRDGRTWAAGERRVQSQVHPNAAVGNAPAVVLREIGGVLIAVLAAVAGVGVALTAFGIH